MHWDVEDHARIVGDRDFTITVDGEPVTEVVELDTDEGWLMKHCDEDRPGHGPAPHLTEDGSRTCCVTLTGEIRVYVEGELYEAA